MKNTLSDDQIRLLRLRAQRLIPQPDQATPAQVLEAVCGVQAQEHPSALLALHVRAEHLTRAAIEQARLEQRAIVRTWAMRGTLHLLTAADARWLIPLLGAGAASMNQRRFIQLGWDASRAARGLRILRDALDGDAALTRAEIVALLKADGLPSEGQAPIHLIFRAAQEGLLCQGPDRGKQPTYASFERWAGPLEPLPRDEALARLARRYLSAYAPAGLADFAAWSGLKTGDARLGWQAVEAEAESFETAQDPLWLLKTQLPWLTVSTQHPALVRPHFVRLLPRYDVYVLGYAKRELLFDPAYAKRINAGGGIIHPTLLVDGHILGTWKTNPRRGAIEVIVEPFEPLPKDGIPALETEVARMAKFLGVEGHLKVG